jgi:Zn-dependent oligopeptidase
MRQINFARYSLACHSTEDGKVNLQNLWQEVFAATMPAVNSEATRKTHAAWGHLTGYAAKYYTYLWSLVFACDLFEHVRLVGLDSELAGQKIKQLLSSGGSVRPEVLLESILGRKPSLEAMAKRKGLN